MIIFQNSFHLAIFLDTYCSMEGSWLKAL